MYLILCHTFGKKIFKLCLFFLVIDPCNDSFGLSGSGGDMGVLIHHGDFLVPSKYNMNEFNFSPLMVDASKHDPTTYDIIYLLEEN